MALTACCGAECGCPGVTGHITITTGSSVSTTTVRSGDRSVRVNGAGTAARATLPHGGTTEHGVVRCYINFATLPNGNVPIVSTIFNSNHRGLWFDASESKFYCGEASETYGASGFTVTTGQWYEIDLYINASATTWTIDAEIDGTALGQHSYAAGSTFPFSTWVFGNQLASWTGDFFVEDALTADASSDYPLGAGHVNHFVPTADGTHNIAGAGDFQRGNTGTDILNATTTAFQLVDDVPLPAGTVDQADCIRCVAPANPTTDYVECIFGPAPGISTPTDGPRIVDIVLAHHEIAGQNGEMEVRLNDNGSFADIYNPGAIAGVTTYRYERAVFIDPPSAATAWHANNDGSNGDFRDLRFRVLGIDSAPDQCLDGILLEAEFLEVSTPMLTQAAFRFYEDGTESGSTAIDAQDTNITRNVDSDSNLLLRVRIQETGAVAGAATDDYQLQYSKNGGVYTAIGSGAVLGFNSSNFAEGDATTNRLGAGSGSFVAGEISEDGEVNDMTLTASNYTEHLYALTIVAAEVTNNDTLDFRVRYNTAVLNAYTVTPRVTIQKVLTTRKLAALGVG